MAQAVLNVQVPQVDVFAVDRLLLPSSNAMQLSAVHIPGDLALFGAVTAASGALTVTPLQAVVARGQTQQFAASQKSGDLDMLSAYWINFGCRPLHRAYEPVCGPGCGYGHRQSKHRAGGRGGRADAGGGQSRFLPSCSPARNRWPSPVRSSAAQRRPGASRRPTVRSASSIKPAPTTQPTVIPAGIAAAVVTATADGQSASAVLCLVNAAFAIPLTPPYTPTPLSAGKTQQFASAIPKQRFGLTLNWSICPSPRHHHATRPLHRAGHDRCAGGRRRNRTG